MTALDEAIACLERLVAFPTVSTESNLDAAAFLADTLEAAGARVEVLADATGQKANVWATLGPEAAGGLVLSGHTDVVPADASQWATDPFRMHVRDGRLFGRGTCDMKGFIACCIASLPALQAASERTPVHFAFTYDEELGCFGAQALIETLRAREARPAMALIGEPTGMRIVDAHKGCCEYRVRFRGAEGHGSAPHLGVNAIEYASRYVSRLLEHRSAFAARPTAGSPFDPPCTTLNLGALHGGTATNVIAGEAWLDWEMRPIEWSDAATVTEDLAQYVRTTLEPEMHAVSSRAGIETEVIGEVCGLAPMSDNPMRDLAATVLGLNDTDAVAFGTEAGLFQQLGMSAIVCGPGHIAQAHKPDEFVEISQLQAALDLLHGIAARL